MSDSDRFSTRQLGGPRPKTAPLRDFDETVAPWVMEFRVVGTHYILRTPAGSTFTIGRAEPERNYHPEIDLTPYDAQGMGVSRKHARLTAKDNRVILQDLGSSNGTFLNGQRLEVLNEYRVRHGDTIKLGHLELTVQFVVKPMTEDNTYIGAESQFNVPKVSNNESLLIVEESEDAAKVLGTTARQAGFSVTAVVTIEDAISEIDRNPPSYVITELMFDEGSGLDVVRYIRNKPECRQTAIMVVTSATAGFNMGQAIEKGADYFLGKPLALEDVIAGLSKLASEKANK
jgi:pSer/pThr/pTyr-binding forkhead associated (FHA) protein